MTQRGATETYNCKNCGDPFTARVADRKRGWARFCSKSCKASKQEQRTHQNARYQLRRAELDAEYDNDEAMRANEEGWDGHKNAF